MTEAFDDEYGQGMEAFAHDHLKSRGWTTALGLSDEALGLDGLGDRQWNAVVAYAKRERAWVCDEQPSEFAGAPNPLAGRAI